MCLFHSLVPDNHTVELGMSEADHEPSTAMQMEKLRESCAKEQQVMMLHTEQLEEKIENMTL